MKKILYLFLVLGLSLNSCKKSETSDKPDELFAPANNSDKISIGGTYFNKDSIMNEVAIGMGLDTSKFYFDQDSETFKLHDFDLEYSADTYLNLN